MQYENFVLNEPRSACCGMPSGQCNCGQQTATVSQPSYIGAGAGSARVSNAAGPQPMPELNWFPSGDEPAVSTPRTTVYNSGGPSPMQELAWNFEKSPAPVANNNRRPTGPQPMQDLDWNW